MGPSLEALSKSPNLRIAGDEGPYFRKNRLGTGESKFCATFIIDVYLLSSYWDFSGLSGYSKRPSTLLKSSIVNKLLIQQY